MGLNAKYQYTHFIYPFVVDNEKYSEFLESILKQEKDWHMKVHEQKSDEKLYNFFLPYMKRFLFPTLFWGKEELKEFKNLNHKKQASAISRLTCTTFEYNLSSIKTGSVDVNTTEAIHFDISKINLICFEPGICFLDIKTEVEDVNELIEFNKILDFNHYFRNLTPRAITNIKSKSSIKAKNIDKIENIAIFINSIISGFETEDLGKIYYDKMFTYSYVCINDWKENLDEMKNDFYKFQYVIDSNDSAIFNQDLDKLEKNTYSRWKYSLFGFSRESGVVLVSDKEKYDITVLPYNFENTYLYMLFIAFYQRISLINFSQDLMKDDKTMAKKMKNRLTKFTHLSWFSQITNSEHGMDIWKRWQVAFELPELYDEVHREFSEYYETIVKNGQDRINSLLIVLYIISILFTGFQLLSKVVNFVHIDAIVIVIMVIAVISYPSYLLLRYVKHKIEARRK